MGKKSRRKKASKNAAKSICKEFKEKDIKETSAMMDEMDNLSLEKQKETLRTALAMMGTDLQVNDSDPFGNGDQSIISDMQVLPILDISRIHPLPIFMKYYK